MLKEIVTKAVVSKGKIVDSSEMEFVVNDNINKVIGCWVINHNYLSVLEEDKVFASGYYDVHIWYAINNSSDTLVYKTTVNYKHEFVLDNNKFNRDECEYKLYCLEYPACSNLELNNNTISLKVKKTLALDVIGESKLLVQVSDGGNREEDSSLGINPNFIKR